MILGKVNTSKWTFTKVFHFITFLLFFQQCFGHLFVLVFLASLNFAILENSFFFSSMSLCFFFRWLCIAALPGFQAEKGEDGSALFFWPSWAKVVTWCDIILKKEFTLDNMNCKSTTYPLRVIYEQNNRQLIWKEVNSSRYDLLIITAIFFGLCTWL